MARQKGQPAPERGRDYLIRMIERAHRRPIRDVVREAWSGNRSQAEAAAFIGCSTTTATKYRRKFIEEEAGCDEAAAPSA